MRIIPLTLITCSLLWSGATLAEKRDAPAAADVQTQDVVTPKKAPRQHLKQKADEAVPQNADTPPAKTVRDSSGKFLKKDKDIATPKAITEPGATARCQDGTLSHSKQHRGACSRHGGVAQWLNE
jgi:hypothetical protein